MSSFPGRVMYFEMFMCFRGGLRSRHTLASFSELDSDGININTHFFRIGMFFKSEYVFHRPASFPEMGILITNFIKLYAILRPNTTGIEYNNWPPCFVKLYRIQDFYEISKHKYWYRAMSFKYESIISIFSKFKCFKKFYR